MDVLDDILDTLALEGALYFRTDFSPPWGVTVPDYERVARFHLVVEGQLYVGFADGSNAVLGPGDVVLIPHGRKHVLADAPGREVPPLETVLKEAGYGGEGVFVVGTGNSSAATQMICGHFNFRDGGDHPILRSLPEQLVITASMRARQPWLDEILRLIARRMFEEGAGSRAAATRLSEVLFIELLRSAVEQGAMPGSVLSALRDRQIGRALHLVHARAAEPWTVERLATEVGMSRSRFAERFSELVGLGPMAYLADWRLQKALSLLDDTRCSVQQVAFRTGYRSPAAFTRAFAGKFGKPPTEYCRGLA